MRNRIARKEFSGFDSVELVEHVSYEQDGSIRKQYFTVLTRGDRITETDYENMGKAQPAFERACKRMKKKMLEDHKPYTGEEQMVYQARVTFGNPIEVRRALYDDRRLYSPNPKVLDGEEYLRQSSFNEIDVKVRPGAYAEEFGGDVRWIVSDWTTDRDKAIQAVQKLYSEIAMRNINVIEDTV